MWWTLYQLLLLVAAPLVRIRLWWRARREPEYARRRGERFGRAPAGVPAGVIWFHTVSAGEAIGAAPLVRALAQRFAEVPVLVTTMTPTGRAQVQQRLGDLVAHCYAPYDFPWAVRRFFDQVRPRLLVLMETELWPNTIAAAAARGVPVVLVNARLSRRSAAGYRRLGSFTRSMLTRLTAIACQYPDDAERFLALGAPPDRVCVAGSVKFDLTAPEDAGPRIAALRRRWALGPAPVWIAGSTHAGEDEMILAAHEQVRRRHPDVRLLLVPRHPARAEQVRDLCRARGWSTALQSQSDGLDDGRAEILIGDRMGELLVLYALADVAFVGGSLVPIGGHNPIEPALWGVPVLMGPYRFNFADVSQRFQQAGALREVADADALAAALGEWFDDETARRAAGAAGQAVVAANRGASARLQALLIAQVSAAIAQ